MERWMPLFLCAAFASRGAAAVPAPIDLLPGEPQNIVDLRGDTPVAVAVLGSTELDARGIDIDSLRLSGARIVKDGQGRTDLLEDVNGDRFLDRVVWFSSSQMRLGPLDAHAVLVGTMLDGRPLEGRDVVRTLAAVLAVQATSSEEEKLPPLQASVLLLSEAGSLAVLGSAQLDPHTLVLGSIRVNGHPIVKGTAGDVVAYRDVNGDRMDDAVLWTGHAFADEQAPRVEAMTGKGRLVQGGNPSAPAPVEGSPAPAGKSLFPYVVSIPNIGPASNYPATIHVSGASGVVTRVRVTLNGIIHTCFNDLDVMLVAPSGQSLVLMSDVGGCNGIGNATNLTFDDLAPATLSPAATPPTSFSSKPINNVVGDPFPAPAPVASGATHLSAFQGTDPNGDWKLFIVDDQAGDMGSMRDGWTLDLVTTTEVCNTSSVTIPDSGPASLYPSSVTLAGLPSNISKVSVRLQGLYHNNFEDLDVLLVDPGGLGVMLLSDAGGPSPQSLWNLTLDDDAWDYIPEETSIFVGAHRPANYGIAQDTFPAPAPQVVQYPDLFRFRGRDPNGAWRLYVVDDSAGFTGAMEGGWCLSVTTVMTSESCIPFPVTIPDAASGSTAGPAFPYPLTMDLTGTTGAVDGVQVALLGLSHTYPDDLDVALQAPSGRAMVLMSDVGGSGDVSNLDVTIDTSGPIPVPDEGPLGPGPYHPSDSEGVNPMPAGGPTSFVGSLQGEIPNGQWKLWINDDAGADVGSMTGFCMSLRLAEPVTSYCSNPASTLTIPAPPNTQGESFPHPWGLEVREEGRFVRKLRVRIEGLSHTWPDDMDILLVGPQNRQVVLMSDAGGSADMVQQWITFDDEAPLELPDEGPLFSNTYRPHNFVQGDPFPWAPSGIEYPELYGFQGTDAHGIWYLYVMDDALGDVGSASRWCLDVFPLYPVGEATHVRWYDKTIFWWDAAPNALGYQVLRGTQADLGSLLTGAPEGCLEPFVDGSPEQSAVVQGVPPSGTFFWYLVVGTSGPNIPGLGPAGEARIGGVETARVVEPAGGFCP
ncbi:MAG TPA: hypothetical protein VFV75_01620 [Candidatus Polarisedimenticolaceae bacterium]|nr:hypothetical protein [Candidatus Polarisedimenticolaceae bacterium]